MNQYVFDPVKLIVETKFGSLRGVTHGDVNIFMGVKYAEAKRFHMPVEQQPWDGVKNFARFTGLPLEQAILPMTKSPAQRFQLNTGSLEAGRFAEFFIE